MGSLSYSVGCSAVCALFISLRRLEMWPVYRMQRSRLSTVVNYSPDVTTAIYRREAPQFTDEQIMSQQCRATTQCWDP
eukprot:scaffold207_cov409-Prasinococcus_capsulatus_cf.AAC.81